MSAKRNNSPTVEQPLEKAVEVAQSVNSEPMTLEAVRRDLNGMKGKKFWRSLDELANTAGVSGRGGARVSLGGAGVGRSRFAARLPEIDGRVDGAGRPGWLHQAAR